MKFEVKIINNYKDVNFDKLLGWFFETWGKNDGFSVEKATQYMKYSFNKERLPRTFVAFDENGNEVGMCHLTMHDVISRPDLYPFLANLYVVPEHRKKGVATELVKAFLKEAKKQRFKEVFLYTPIVGLYEKLGWEYVEDIATFCTPHIQRLYKFDLSKK